jgi:hypothetical protein
MSFRFRLAPAMLAGEIRKADHCSGFHAAHPLEVSARSAGAGDDLQHLVIAQL